MAVYCAIVEDAVNNVDWNGTTHWGVDATSDKYNPTFHATEGARDAQYTSVHATINAWEGVRDGVASGDDEYGIVQGLWDNDDTNTFDIIGWTATSITIKAMGQARHAGVWDDGADSPHRVVVTDNGYVTIALEDNITYDGLQVHNTQASDSSNSCIRIADQGIVVRECILNAADSGGEGIDMNSAGVDGKVYNTVIYRSPESTDGEGIYCDNGDNLDVYNCTIYGFAQGCERDAGTMTVTNTISFNNGTDFDGTITVDYCGSDDDTGTNSQTPSGGNWANEMTNYATYDFTLDGAGAMYNTGETDPSGDSETLDITGATRTAPWSIGAFEYDVAPAAGIIQHSSAYSMRRKKEQDGEHIPGMI